MSLDKVDLKAVELAIAQLEKEYGKNAVMHGNTLPDDVRVISTGNFKLDMALGVFGLPLGRIVEIFGAEGLGKSLLAILLIANCQKAGGKALYVDVECDSDPAWMAFNGVNLDDLFIAQPESGEEALEIVDKMIKTGAFDLVVVDSVAALTPKAEIEGSMSDVQVGAQPRLMGKALRKLRQPVSENETCLVFINQIRDKIGPMQQGTTTPGGRALKFYSSVRIELKRISNVTVSATGEVIGTRVKATVVKNKVAAPMKSVEYDVLHGVGFNNGGAIVELAERFKLIRKSGSYYYKNGEDKSFAQGLNNAAEAILSDPKWLEELKAQIKEEYAKL